MKRFFTFLLMLVPLLLLSCEGDDTREVILTPDKSSITADGQDIVTFTVKYGDDVITSGVKITANGETITGMSFSTNTEGDYKFIAEYKGKTSKEVIVNALKPDQLILTPDKETITADGTDKVTFTVKLGTRDVTSEAEISVGATKLTSNEFTSTTAGEYKFTASYDGKTSAEVIVNVTEVSSTVLVLTVDKSTIVANGEDKATFTITRDGEDVTDDCSICMKGGLCLLGSEYTADEPGEEEFYATLKSDETVKSNYVKVTAVSDDSLILSVDKSTITADNTDEARFTVMRGGVDVTDDCSICMKDGACLTSRVFTTSEAGEYEFYANLKSDETVKSNYVKVTATAADVLQLSADKTTIKGNNVEETVFTVKLNEEDVTSGAEIYMDGTKIESNKFKTYGAGEYEFTAKYQGKESNALKITVQKVDLVLSADKTSIDADGTDAVTFTAKLDDIDVTSGVAIKYGGTTLASNTFSTDESGEYEFTATLKAAESVVSNTVRIVATAVTVDELILSVDNTNIVADGQQKAIFTVTFNGTDVTLGARLFKNGEEYNSREFLGMQPGEYVFQANYEYDGNFIESNAVTVTVTALPDDFDASRELHKNVAYFTFTATWCGPCYTYKGYLKNVMADYPDNIVQLNIYSASPYNPSDAKVRYAGISGLVNNLTSEGRFSLGGFPTSIAELRQELGDPGYVPTESHVRSAYDSYISNPAKTGIKVVSGIANGKIDVTVTVGAKEAGTYYMGVFLVEDNISAPQTGSSGAYNHIDVVRDQGMNNIFGEEIGNMTAGQSIPKTFSFNVDSGYNTDNLSIVVYTLYEEGGKRVIANTVKAPASGVTPYKYTN